MSYATTEILRTDDALNLERSPAPEPTADIEGDFRLCESADVINQTERLVAIGQMLTGVTHECRNALQRAQASLDVLSLELQGQQELLEFTTRTQHALADLHHLFDAVRCFAAPLNLQVEHCDLRAIWSRVWSELDISHCGKPIDLIESVRCDDTRCDVDDHRLRQDFRNIFKNGIAACPNPGQIELEIANALLQGLPGVEIRVRDNGPGLTHQQLGGIFKPFFTTKRMGTGLGMAIAKQIVNAHGGHISARNASAGGAEMVICLPGAHRPADFAAD